MNSLQRSIICLQKLMPRNWVLDFFHYRQHDLIAGEPNANTR